MAKTHDTLLLPYVTIVTQQEGDEHFVVGCEIDWADTFRNCWANNDAGRNVRVVVDDGEPPETHPAAVEACAFLDGYSDDAALLRRLADLIDAGKAA